WVLSRGGDVVPLVGARTRERLAEALGVLDLDLTAEELAELDEALPPDAVAGEPPNPQQMAPPGSGAKERTPPKTRGRPQSGAHRLVRDQYAIALAIAEADGASSRCTYVAAFPIQNPTRSGFGRGVHGSRDARIHHRAWSRDRRVRRRSRASTETGGTRPRAS